MRHLRFFVAASLIACTGSPVPGELPAGQWGGEHVSMIVSAQSVSLEFDCAHGTVDEAPQVDSDGEFNLNGTYVQEHGGPIRDGEEEARRPAVYFGRLEGSRITLSIRMTHDGVQIGPFAARLGQEPRLFKCL